MEFKEVIEKRYSARYFTQEEVRIEDLREMINYAGLAPSVNNSRPWRFIVITNKDLLGKMEQIVSRKIDNLLPDTQDEEKQKIKSKVLWHSTFFVNAPSVIAVAMKPYEAVVDRLLHSNLNHDELNKLRGYPDILSLGAALENLILGAVDLGYSSCWLSGPLVAREELEEFLSIKEPWKLSAMVAIGKSKGDINKSDTKSPLEILELL